MTSSIPSSSPDRVDSPDDARLAELGAQLEGRVLRPGTEDYTALATLWNVAVVNDHLAAVPPVVDAVAAHAAALLAAMAPWSTGGGLPNVAATGDLATVAARSDAATFARLGALVAAYDPRGVLVAGGPFRPG